MMQSLLLRSPLILLVVLVFAGSSHAAFVFSIEDDVEVTPGEIAVVGIFVSGTAGSALDGYTLPIEIGGDGRGFSLAFAPGDFVQEIDTFTDMVSVGGETDLDFPLVQDYERLFTDAGDRIPLTSEVQLFNLLIDTTGMVPGETIPLFITSTSSNPNPFSVTGFDDGQNVTYTDPSSQPVTLIGGSIRAVPEPSGMALVMAISCLWLQRRRV